MSKGILNAVFGIATAVSLVVTPFFAQTATALAGNDDHCLVAVLEEVIEPSLEDPSEVEFLIQTKDVAHAWFDPGDGTPVFAIPDDETLRIMHKYWPSQKEGFSNYWPVVLYELPDEGGAWHCGWDGEKPFRVEAGEAPELYLSNLRK